MKNKKKLLYYETSLELSGDELHENKYDDLFWQKELPLAKTL